MDKEEVLQTSQTAALIASGAPETGDAVNFLLSTVNFGVDCSAGKGMELVQSSSSLLVPGVTCIYVL